MKTFKILFAVAVAFFLQSSLALGADFDWLKDFNVTAQADPSGFRAQLSTRFQIGDAQISAVVGNVENPADAYMVLRLGEIANRPPEQVLKEYKASKGKGWGVLAKNLGIKPGSREFQALKKGHDLKQGEQGKAKDKEGKGGKGDKGGGRGKNKR